MKGRNLKARNVVRRQFVKVYRDKFEILAQLYDSNRLQWKGNKQVFDELVLLARTKIGWSMKTANEDVLWPMLLIYLKEIR